MFQRCRDLVSTQRARIREHLLASGALGIGYVIQLFLQLTYFLILTRMLGAEGFGLFAATMAAITLLSPFAGFGYAEVALVRISQNLASTGTWLANGLVVTSLLGAAMAGLLALITSQIHSLRWLDSDVVLLLAICELVLVRGCYLMGRVYQARGRLTITSALNVAVTGCKVAAALAVSLTDSNSLLSFTLILSANLTVVWLFGYAGLARAITVPAPSLSGIMREGRFAASFAGGVVCKTAYTDADKLLLARWWSEAIVGTYAAGHKILALSFMPVRAVLEATFPQQLKLGASDPRACLRFTLACLGVCLLLAAIIGGGLFAVAPWLPLILGDDFASSVTVLRVGAILPLLQAIHYTLGNYLTSTNRQGTRVSLQFATLLFYLAFGVFAISRFSWYGAIATCLLSESLLGLSFAVVCIHGHLACRHVSSRTTTLHSLP